MSSCDVVHGDCTEVLPRWAEDGLRFDAVVCDPPYHLTSIVKRFGAANAAPAQFGRDGAFARSSRGFMGQTWDGGDIAFQPETWAAVLSVMKPGAHLIAFGGSRTWHRIACAIEDAGFEIRDTLMWVYGSGFPKSHDISKGIDKAAGATRNIVCRSARHVSGKPGQRTEGLHGSSTFAETIGMEAYLTAPATDSARRWEGWGSALKPAVEPIILARKPLEGTLAANTLTHGCGGLNIDECRVSLAAGADASQLRTMNRGQRTKDTSGQKWGLSKTAADTRWSLRPDGRWPPNLLHDGSPEVLACFPASAGQQGDLRGHANTRPTKICFGDMPPAADHPKRGDFGSAARFFPSFPFTDDERRLLYHTKANTSDRAGSKHPTVKPVALMRWLCRLVTPLGGLILDPFAGSGTTGAAAIAEGFNAVLVEQNADYVADIRKRLDAVVSLR